MKLKDLEINLILGLSRNEPSLRCLPTTISKNNLLCNGCNVELSIEIHYLSMQTIRISNGIALVLIFN